MTEQNNTKLQAFKAYVHERLDQAGIPTHPNGPHSAQGCRIGDRLDIALAREQRLREALEKARAWHESEDKALSKSGRFDREQNWTHRWARLQHKEQMAEISAALSATAPAAQEEMQ